MSKIIGIDLGTTNSCVAFMDGNQSKVIENSEGYRTTPSVVAFTENNEVVVGSAAKRYLLTSTSNVVSNSKRIIGKKCSEITNMAELPFTVVAADNGDAWIKIGNKKISPQEVAAAILRKMKSTAEDYFGEKITDAVITVPAYFNDAQRQATKDAGKVAGLNVKRIINEPTAAALAFGLDKQCGKDLKIVVYDLGGGTFDVSVIEIAMIESDKQFEVLSTNGDTFLGGEDFDNAIVNYCVTTFKSLEGVDLTGDALAIQRLKEAAEKAKVELSTLKETEINVPFVTSVDNVPKHLLIKLTRAKLEAIVGALVARTLTPCEIALKDAGLSVADINEVILVGGMTRMPLIQSEVERFFNKKPKRDVNPDEAIAVGAAIQGQILVGQRKDVLLLDVIPLSLGIETLGGIMVKMIKKNTTIPTSYSQVFSTAEDNQTAVTIKVFQGERELVAANKLLGEFNLEGIKPAPKGIPQIEVTFDIDSNGILSVSAKDKATGVSNTVTIKSSSGLTDAEIEKMIADAELNKQKDLEHKLLIEEKNNIESLKFEIESYIKSTTTLTAEVSEKLKGFISQLNTLLSSTDVSLLKAENEKIRNAFIEIKNATKA
ncbi:molecular chaperone DnaK [Candidatus Vidania fulgoroideae]|uniref:Chaperone protein DnaK n=1 Tax=Candidatus Vidania fulgoroideorum TaxID=881286 RepID=A0A974X738_9PROT|nr:molecular chaperone DnaK [Candidatus Vidania fulgoroideae]